LSGVSFPRPLSFPQNEICHENLSFSQGFGVFLGGFALRFFPRCASFLLYFGHPGSVSFFFSFFFGPNLLALLSVATPLRPFFLAAVPLRRRQVYHKMTGGLPRKVSEVSLVLLFFYGCLFVFYLVELPPPKLILKSPFP